MRINQKLEVCEYHNKETTSDEETPWNYVTPTKLRRQPRHPSLVGLRPLDPPDAQVERQIEVIAEPGFNFVDEPQAAEVYHGRPVASERDEASVAQRSRLARELRPGGGKEFLIDNTTDLELESPFSPVDDPAAAVDASQMPPDLLGTMNTAILRNYMGNLGDENVYSVAKAATAELTLRKELAAERAMLVKKDRQLDDALQLHREDQAKSMAAVVTEDTSAWQHVAATETAVSDLVLRERAAAAEADAAAETARKQNLTSNEKERTLSAARRAKLVSAKAVAEDREEERKREERRAVTARLSTQHWNEAEELRILRAKLAAEKAEREEKAAVEKAAVEKAWADRRRMQEENAKARAAKADVAKEAVERQKRMRLEKEEAEKKYEQALVDEVLPYLIWFFLSCGVYKQDFNNVGSRSPIVITTS